MIHYSFLVLADFRRIKHNQFFRPTLVFTLLLLLLWLLFGDVVCFIDILCLHFAVLKWKFVVLRFQMLILAVTAATIPKQNLRGCRKTDSLAKLRFVILRWDGMWWVGCWYYEWHNNQTITIHNPESIQCTDGPRDRPVGGGTKFTYGVHVVIIPRQVVLAAAVVVVVVAIIVIVVIIIIVVAS